MRLRGNLPVVNGIVFLLWQDIFSFLSKQLNLVWVSKLDLGYCDGCKAKVYRPFLGLQAFLSFFCIMVILMAGNFGRGCDYTHGLFEANRDSETARQRDRGGLVYYLDWPCASLYISGSLSHDNGSEGEVIAACQ